MTNKKSPRVKSHNQECVFITDNDSIQLEVLISDRLKPLKAILIPVVFLFDPMPQRIIMWLWSLTT